MLWLREFKHQPRLIGYPVRVKHRHLIEQVLVGVRGSASFLVTGDNHLRVQRCQPVEFDSCVFEVADAVALVSFPFVRSMSYSFRCQSESRFRAKID